MMEPKDSVIVTVTVNDAPWRRIPSLQDAEPDDTVFVLNPQTGTITFGDGVNGAAPPIGSNITASYTYGAGAAGNISKRVDDCGDLLKFWIIARADRQELGWGSRVEESFDDAMRES